MSSTASDTHKPASTVGGGGRLPSLNQLAARININGVPNGVSSSSSSSSNTTTTTTATAAPRPRLAASILRTTSNASLSTVASSQDSTAVNPPFTRTASPSAMSVSVSPPNSTTPSNENGSTNEGEQLTSEKLAKFNEETSGVAAVERKVKVGYKNIPSLDAITARVQREKARALSIDGSAKPPEAEMIEDPKTPGVPMKAPEHPLQFPWTIYHDTKSKFPFTPATNNPASASLGSAAALASAAPASASQPSSATSPDGTFPFPTQPPESTDYEAGLTVIGTFTTVEQFCRYFNWLKPPSKLERNSNYHLFKAGIKPMWEDPSNANGGKWVLTMKNNPELLDRCWKWLTMALVGEELEEGGDEICGAVVSLRSKVDRIQVWTRKKDEVEKLNGIGKKLVKLLDVGEADGIGLEFQYNTDDRPLPNKFLSIQALPVTSYRSSFAGPQGGAQAQGGGGGGGHAHTRSIGGIGVGGTNGGFSPVDQPPPMSAGAGGGAFGSFGIGIGGAQGGGGNTWRSARRG